MVEEQPYAPTYTRSGGFLIVLETLVSPPFFSFNIPTREGLLVSVSVEKSVLSRLSIMRRRHMHHRRHHVGTAGRIACLNGRCKIADTMFVRKASLALPRAYEPMARAY